MIVGVGVDAEVVGVGGAAVGYVGGVAGGWFVGVGTGAVIVGLVGVAAGAGTVASCAASACGAMNPKHCLRKAVSGLFASSSSCLKMTVGAESCHNALS